MKKRRTAQRTAKTGLPDDMVIVLLIVLLIDLLLTVWNVEMAGSVFRSWREILNRKESPKNWRPADLRVSVRYF